MKQYSPILMLMVILLAAPVFAEFRGSDETAPPKLISERLAPVELDAAVAPGATAAWEAFLAQADLYRKMHDRDKPDKVELDRLGALYVSNRDSLRGTFADALFTYTWSQVLEHHGMDAEAIKLLSEAITRFAGTAEASRLRQRLGEYRLDKMNDAKAAALEFAAIPNAPPLMLGPNQIDPWLITRDAWVRAQINLARCELRQGMVEQATAHFEALLAAYPKLREPYTQECAKFDAERKKAAKLRP